MKQPNWVDELIEQVCKDHKRKAPKLTWRNASRESSSGKTRFPRSSTGTKLYTRTKTGRLIRFKGGISIMAGTNEQDQRLVLLHELAHWLTVKYKNQGHNQKFWETAFDLYERYGVDMDYAYNREKDYKQTAKLVYAKRTSK